MGFFRETIPAEVQGAAEAHRARLCEELTAHRRVAAASHLYLLIDCGLAPRINRFAQRRLSGHPHAVLLHGTPESHLADRFSPWLVAIPGEEAEAWQTGKTVGLLRELCLLAQTYPAISWLWSSNSLPDMANHLRFFMGGELWNEQTNAAEGDVFLRYFDARVLPGFISLLTPAQRDAFLLPIDTWCLWDRHLHWHVWQGSDQAVSATDPTILRYSLAQQERLARQTQPDKILHLIHETHGTTADGTPLRAELLDLLPDAQYRRIAPLVGEARRLGLTSDADLMLFCVLALDVHPQFFEHPAVQPIVISGLRAGHDFSALLNTVPDSAWLDLEQDRHLSERWAPSTPAASLV